MGGNDRYNDCVWPSLANLHDTVTAVNGHPEVMSEAECEYFYARETGFTPLDKSTDKGAVQRRVIEDWCAHGWPGDDTLKPLGWCDVRPDEIPVAIHMLGGVPFWMMLPLLRPGVYDFQSTDLPGEYAHAAFFSGATWNTLSFVTWASEVTVTMEWARKYVKEAFGVLHPAWHIPREVIS